MTGRRLVAVMTMMLPALLFPASNAGAHLGAPTLPLVFPVKGAVSYSDSFGLPRSGGRSHEGVDIFANKGQELVAAAPSTVDWMGNSGLGGYMIQLQDDDGNNYFYAHMNNDTPGTDDGLGGDEGAYAPGIAPGARVDAGQVIGYVGDSGNAENTRSHLHFELEPGGKTECPYPSLKRAIRPTSTWKGLTFSRVDGMTAEPRMFAPDGSGYLDTSVIRYELDRPANVFIRVLASWGEARSLLPGYWRAPGTHEIPFNGLGNGWRKLAAGTYLYEVAAKDEKSGLLYSKTGRVVLRPGLSPTADAESAVSRYWIHPNPVRPLSDGGPRTTSFCFTLSQDALVTIRVVSYKGEVRTVIKDLYRPAGRHYEGYTGTDDAGKVLAPGNYRYHVEAVNAKGTGTTTGIIGVAD